MIIARKKVRVIISMPEAYAPVWGILRDTPLTAIADTIARTNARKRSDPALPAYMATQV